MWVQVFLWVISNSIFILLNSIIMKIENLKCKSYKVTTSDLVATVQAANELAVRTALSDLDKITVYTDNEAVHEVVEVLEGYKYVDSIVAVGDGWHLVKLMTEPLSLDEIKARKIAEITAYDTSNEVNSFSLNGHSIWLDKSTRVGLMNSINIESSAGREETTLWLGTVSLSINIEQAIQMLSALELYALECYNKTAEHKANVLAFNDYELVEKYDFTAGYPEKLNFTT